MEIITTNIRETVVSYLKAPEIKPLLLHGDARSVLEEFPDNSIDMMMTSPPYWQKRQYANGGIGLEREYKDYIANLCAIIKELYRVLKDTGSFWLNIGDSYKNKRLLGIPWRVVFEMTDRQGWILRNNVIWNKVKGGPDNSKDKLRNIHENIFHFVKKPHGYYYNVDAIRTKPREAKVVNGAIVSATGVSGVRYKRQIELSTELTEGEKEQAMRALEEMLQKIRAGETSDFRMIIRGKQRTTHSDSEKLSGRAKELKEKGFYFLCYHPNGTKPGDLWDIIPEDTQKRKTHYTAYPTDLCKIPILATCPPKGTVLDPFCGTGTTLTVAQSFQRKGCGIDISQEYLQESLQRLRGIYEEQQFTLFEEYVNERNTSEYE
jgi:site-specific DNA-methyltransferase (adenine-specific)